MRSMVEGPPPSTSVSCAVSDGPSTIRFANGPPPRSGEDEKVTAP